MPETLVDYILYMYYLFSEVIDSSMNSLAAIVSDSCCMSIGVSKTPETHSGDDDEASDIRETGSERERCRVLRSASS